MEWMEQVGCNLIRTETFLARRGSLQIVFLAIPQQTWLASVPTAQRQALWACRFFSLPRSSLVCITSRPSVSGTLALETASKAFSFRSAAMAELLLLILAAWFHCRPTPEQPDKP